MNIDRIARQMTHEEPSPDLEARIRARLDEAQPRAQSSSWWLWRVAAPAGALASIALIVGVQVSKSPEVQMSRGPEVQEARPSTGSGRPELVESRGPEVVFTSRRPDLATSQLTSEEVAWMERRIPALDPVTALQIDGLSVDAIQPEPIAITPLIMTALPTDGGSSERHDNR